MLRRAMVELPLISGDSRRSVLARILYVGITNSATGSDTLPGFFKTADGGRSWTQLPYTPDDCAPFRCGSRQFIRIHPTNPNVVFAGGTGMQKPLWRTLDAGNLLAEISVGVNGVTVFPDPTSVAFSRDGTKLYFGSDGGVLSIPDRSVAGSPPSTYIYLVKLLTGRSGSATGNRTRVLRLRISKSCL